MAKPNMRAGHPMCPEAPAYDYVQRPCRRTNSPGTAPISTEKLGKTDDPQTSPVGFDDSY